MRNFNAALLATGAALALPACGQSTYETDPVEPMREQVVLQGGIVPDKEITGDDCDYFAKVEYPEKPVNPSAEDKEAYYFALSNARMDELNLAVINNDMQSAKAMASTVIEAYKASETGSILDSDDAEAFLAKPGEYQLRHKAECASLAGQISTAESIVVRIQDEELKADAQNWVETWEGYHAEQITQNAVDAADIETGFKILEFVDSSKERHLEEQDEVEGWVDFKANQIDYQDILPQADALLEIVDKYADNEGKHTKASIRDTIESKIKFEAEQAEDPVEAAKILQRIDHQGEVTRGNVQAELDKIN